jgi:hypothetical protein
MGRQQDRLDRYGGCATIRIEQAEKDTEAFTTDFGDCSEGRE